MSVSCMINNPKNEFEKEFFFPVATEAVYEHYWHKFAIDNNLFWLESFLHGSCLEKKFFQEVMYEIMAFKSFLLKDIDPFYNDKKDYILNRIDLFSEKLNEAEFLRDDIELYIG